MNLGTNLAAASNLSFGRNPVVEPDAREQNQPQNEAGDPSFDAGSDFVSDPEEERKDWYLEEIDQFENSL